MIWPFRTVPRLSPAQQLSALSHHARIAAYETHRERVKVRARQICAEKGLEVPEVLR